MGWHDIGNIRGRVPRQKHPNQVHVSEGGMASSARAAQFIKALTRIVWRVVGRRTSLRLVQCTKVNSGISSTLVLQRSTLLSSRQLSHACAPLATKCFVRASAVIPVELRQPGASSLVLACSADPRRDGSSLKVNSARSIHPWKRHCPKLGFAVEHICNPFRCIHPLQGTAFRKGFVSKISTTRSQDTV